MEGGMTTTRTDSRQPDYIIGTHGIPQLVSRVVRPVVKRNKMLQSNNNASMTDPIKLNKCLYNLTVRNAAAGNHPAKSSSETKRDIAIRNQYGNKSNSTTTSNNGSASTGTSVSLSSVSPSPSSSSASVFSNWRGASVASSMTRYDPARNTTRSCANTSSIPRSRIHSLRGDISLVTSTINRSSNHNVRIGEVNGGTHALLNSRQRRYAGDPSDLNRADDCGSNVVRQCRLSATIRERPPAVDNRLSYQRKYDRTIFGFNRLDQFVLPPLQI